MSLLLLLPGSAARAELVREIAPDVTDLPYRTLIAYTVRPGSEAGARYAHMTADIDGDGQDELVTTNGIHLLGHEDEDVHLKAVFQINLEAGWRFAVGYRYDLGVARDLDGDGYDEIYVVVHADDRSAWRFQVFDVATEKRIVDAALPLGEDLRADGLWDGRYMPVGFLDDADGAGRPAVVLLTTVGYDTTGRGLTAVDPRTGEIIWRRLTGFNPEAYSAVVTDLEGDGHQEIVMFGNSPDNLGGRMVNGSSDDRAAFMVVSDRGEVLWCEEAGGPLQSGEVRVHDLDGDGVREIITCTMGGKVGETNKLVVWDFPSRSRVVTQRQGAGYRGLAVLPGDRPGTSRLLTGSNDGYVTRYLFTGGQLVRDGLLLTGRAHNWVSGAFDMLPEPGAEVAVETGDDGEIGALLLVSGDLEPLAAFHPDQRTPMRAVRKWRGAPSDSMLVMGLVEGYTMLRYEAAPAAVPAAAFVAAGVAVLAGLLAAAYALGRRRGAREGAPLPEAAGAAVDLGADREVLRRVWRQLDDVKHERFLEVNHGMRRLVWLLEAYATDLGASEDLRRRIGQLLDDFAESMRPRLLEILRLAREEHFETELVDRTARSLSLLADQLSDLEARTLTVAKVQACCEEMKQEMGRVEEGLLALWESLRRYFSTDPVRMLQGMLLLREVEFQRAGVRSIFLGAEDVADPLCLIDNAGLRYVLDNLVNNALRAMADGDGGELRIEVARAGREVTLRVTDTGHGVPSDVRDRIFNGRTSDRPGGGVGLYRSREILQKWGGEISLAGSAPGQGATFVVQLRAAHPAGETPAAGRTLAGEA